MSIWGSLIGGMIGFSLGGPFGMLLGSLIGEKYLEQKALLIILLLNLSRFLHYL